MMPEAKARQSIDALLVAAGWYVCNVADAMQVRIVAEANYHSSIVHEVKAHINLKRAQTLRQATLSKSFCRL